MAQKLGIRYIAPINDMSGYAEAARNYICALIKQGLEITVEPISFEKVHNVDYGHIQQIISPYIRRKIDYQVNIIHLTPENYPRFIEPNKYNIGFYVWETSKLPPTWPALINFTQESWVPSDYTAEASRTVGLTRPIYKFPHTIDEESLPKPQGLQRKIASVPDGHYTFYSIFQWTERKNASGLLLAYLTEFTTNDKVCLVLKTYKNAVAGASLEQEKTWIKQQISYLRSSLHLDNTPPISLIVEPLSKEDMVSLHGAGDCLVLPSHSEGWGLTQFEAMYLGKPVIATRYSGNLEFMNDDNSLLVDYVLSPVWGMPWEIYRGDMLWGAPLVMSLREKMRWAYEHQTAAELMGSKAREDICSRFNWETVGKAIKGRLTEIAATVGRVV